MVGLPLMRTSTLAIPISTFAFLIVVYNVVANWDRVTGGSSGLVSIPSDDRRRVGGALGGRGRPRRARLQMVGERLPPAGDARGRGGGPLDRDRRDRGAADRLRLSGMLCGIGGALAVHQSGVLNPTTFYFGATVTTLTMLVVGGARSVFGAVIGAIAVATRERAAARRRETAPACSAWSRSAKRRALPRSASG